MIVSGIIVWLAAEETQVFAIAKNSQRQLSTTPNTTRS